MRPFKLELESSIQINATRAAVWAVFTDIARWTEWCSVCLRSSTQPEFAWRQGERISLKFRMARIGVPFNVAITGTEPEICIAWASTKFSVTAVRTFSFHENSPGETTVTDHKLFTSPLLPLRLFYPRPLIRRMTESMLADLKAECERVATR